MTALLRACAMAIAAAALVDPACSVERTERAQGVIVRAANAHAEIERDLAATFPHVRWTSRAASDGRLPCAPHERCVVITDGSIDAV